MMGNVEFKLEKIRVNELIVSDSIKRSQYAKVDDIVKSIKHVGLVKPTIIVDKNNKVQSGSRMLKALEKIGENEVYVIKAYGLTEEQKSMMQLIDEIKEEFSPVEKAERLYNIFKISGINKEPKYIVNALRRASKSDANGKTKFIHKIADEIREIFGIRKTDLKRYLSILILSEQIKEEINEEWYNCEKSNRYGKSIFSLEVLENLSFIRSEDHQLKAFKIIRKLPAILARDFVSCFSENKISGKEREEIFDIIIKEKVKIDRTLIDLLKKAEKRKDLQGKIIQGLKDGKTLNAILMEVREAIPQPSLVKDLRWEDIYEEICDIQKLTHKVYIGDSEKVLKEIKDKSVDLIITSPPYFGETYEIEKDQWKSYEEYLEKLERIFRECYRVLRPGRYALIVVSPVSIYKSKHYPLSADIIRVLIEVGFDYRYELHWRKQSTVGKGAGRFLRERKASEFTPNLNEENIIVVRKEGGWKSKYTYKQEFIKEKLRDYLNQGIDVPINISNRYHQFEFPELLAELLVLLYSDPGDTVLDCFAGAGTIGAVCRRLFRNSIQIERNPSYLDVIRRRLLEDCEIIQWNEKSDKRIVLAKYLDVEIEYKEFIRINLQKEKISVKV